MATKQKTRYLFYKVVPGRFKIGSKTKTNATDPVTDTISIEAMESPDTGYIKAKSAKGECIRYMVPGCARI